jgi:hypothetical protein
MEGAQTGHLLELRWTCYRWNAIKRADIGGPRVGALLQACCMFKVTLGYGCCFRTFIFLAQVWPVFAVFR